MFEMKVELQLLDEQYILLLTTYVILLYIRMSCHETPKKIPSNYYYVDRDILNADATGVSKCDSTATSNCRTGA